MKLPVFIHPRDRVRFTREERDKRRIPRDSPANPKGGIIVRRTFFYYELLEEKTNSVPEY
jgi:hypothetical protein